MSRSATSSRSRTALEIARSHQRATLVAPRGTFPIVRAFVAELRAAGLEPILTYASEGGLEIGVRDTKTGVPVSLDHRAPKRKTARR